ncbi:MAG TPA: flagellar hook-associated protein FlgL [Spongiibacteraceae bacterium]|nr:flagellar hook-associated protein FlgL [Spongiibacteraceae bacterium]
MDRISLSQIFSQGLRGMNTSQSQVYKTQGQLSSGLRVQTPADDPIAAAQILQLTQTQSEIDQYQKNIAGGTSSLELEDSQLGAVTTLLTRVRELAISAGDGSLAQSDRAAIAAELNSRIDELAGLANTRNSNGEYIFAGFQGQQAPFVNNSSTYTYRGDDGQRQVQVGTSTFVPINDSGSSIFVAIPSSRLPTTPGVTNTGNATMAMGQIADLAQFNASFGAVAAPGSSSIDLNGHVPVLGNQVVINGVTFTFADAGTGNADGVTVVDPTHVTVSTDLTLATVNANTTGTALAAALNAAKSDPQTAAALAPITASIGSGVVTLNDIRPGLSTTVGRTVTFLQGTGASYFGGTPPVGNMNVTGSDGGASYTVTVNMTAVPPTYQVDSVPPAVPVATGNFVSGQPITFNGVQVDIVGTPGDGDTFTVGSPSTQDVFTTLHKLTDGLLHPIGGSTSESSQRIADLISESLDNLDAAQTNVSTVRAKIGARLNTLESSGDLQDGVGLVNKKILSQVRDLDYASAISQLTQENLVLQAAQQSFAKVSGLSLFNFLN